MIAQLLVVVSVMCLVMVIPGPDMVLVLRNTFLAGRGARDLGVVGAGQRSGRNWLVQGFINNVLDPKGALFYFGVRLALTER